MRLRKKIVLIDDEGDLCFFIKQNLEKTGEFTVFTALNGEDGINLIRLEQPDLVILDILMPSLSGPDVAIILKNDQRTKHIPVIFLTAIITREEIGNVPMRKIGSQHHIAKPIETNTLVKCINEVLAG